MFRSCQTPGHNVYHLLPWQTVTSFSVTWRLTCAHWSRTLMMTLTGSTSTQRTTLRCRPEDTYSLMPMATARGRRQSSARLISRPRACSVQASGRSDTCNGVDVSFTGVDRQTPAQTGVNHSLLVRSVWEVRVCCKHIKDPSMPSLPSFAGSPPPGRSPAEQGAAQWSVRLGKIVGPYPVTNYSIKDVFS